ncbi:hypothetical protein [Microcystis aeruginosa]|uniref:hypothetical protein n=1 Tax=Microcystis aeruginosa TaxID=1126 RepID=UPI00188218B9|nr:hypothetical protein [Microcystis aeruginosa]MBE8993225.1 hypothetical protein [Microcystis aeruginosa LEGE 91341]
MRYAIEWRTRRLMFLFAAIISDKKPKSTIGFIIKLVRYAIEWRILQFIFLFERDRL